MASFPTVKQDPRGSQDTAHGVQRQQQCSLQTAFLPTAIPTTAGLILLIQQEPLDGVWQRQGGNQMKPVLAKSSSHNHTAPTQQGPGDTYGARGRDRRRRKVNYYPNSKDKGYCD